MERNMSKIKRISPANRRWLLAASVVVALLVVFFAKSDFFMSTLGFAKSTPGATEQTGKAAKLFTPDRQAIMSAESQGLGVSLQKSAPCADCGGGKSFTFLIENRSRGTAKTFTIENDTAQVDEISIVNPSLAVVFGSVNSTVKSVNVINTEVGAVADYFNCLSPKLSSDKRFVAYVKASPRFSSPGDWSYVYLVYDLAAPAALNRLPGGMAAEKSEDRMSIGIPVYPAENFKRKVYTASIKDESQAHILASDGFFWINKNTLAFVDRSNKANRLVLIDLSYGADRARVITRPLDAAALVDTKSCKESVNAPESLIQVTDISSPSDKSGFVRLTFEPMGQCLTRSTLDIAIN